MSHYGNKQCKPPAPLKKSSKQRHKTEELKSEKLIKCKHVFLEVIGLMFYPYFVKPLNDDSTHIFSSSLWLQTFYLLTKSTFSFSQEFKIREIDDIKKKWPKTAKNHWYQFWLYSRQIIFFCKLVTFFPRKFTTFLVNLCIFPSVLRINTTNTWHPVSYRITKEGVDITWRPRPRAYDGRGFSVK